MTDVERVYKEIREEQSPYFEDGDIEYYLEKNHGDSACHAIAKRNCD